MIRILASLLGVVTLYAQPLRNRPGVLSVCELIEHRSKYSGLVVAVRGEVKAGGHGPYLVASGACQYRLITRGIVWPNIIYLAYPDNHSKIETYHADFQVDWRSVRRAEYMERRNRYNPDTDQIFRTYTGLFLTYLDLEDRVSGVPGSPKLGFGPVGLEAPAQLLIKSISDVVVVHGAAKSQ